jgi:hypothetical protein
MRLISLLILPLLVSLAIAYFLIPRTYQSTAALWAPHRYEIIGATGPESDLQATPAQTQAAALSELLQTRSFALAVANETGNDLTQNLPTNVKADPQRLDDALFNEISKNVVVTPEGYNLYEISYINRNPKVAQHVIEAVMKNFASQSKIFSVIEGQHILDGYQTALIKAQSDADSAAAAEAQYIRAHPSLSLQQLANDPQYVLLHSATQQAQGTVQGIRENIAALNQTISAQGTSDDSLFRVIDNPISPSQPVSRMKQYLFAAGIGLGVGLLACILYIILLLRRERGVYTALNLQKVTNLPVVMQLPHLAPSTVTQLVKGSGYDAVMIENKSWSQAKG